MPCSTLLKITNNKLELKNLSFIQKDQIPIPGISQEINKFKSNIKEPKSCSVYSPLKVQTNSVLKISP
jgi:hypothetical protein